ncbi:succinylglutamate desuccinylase [Craterilacuibacter sp.]|uniref:succinylglutamate desuccinylase n=1 Tax=Craterilacuibacter sp. TaxID=2870909 RepID=UPI003F3A3E80
MPFTSHADFLSATLACTKTDFPARSTLTQLRLTWHGPGILELTPHALAQNADQVLISAGIHGNETAPVEVLNAILNDIIAGRLMLKVRLLAILGHPEALQRGERYLDYDMNRLFAGAHRQHAQAREAARAAELEHAAERFFATSPASARRLHYDLHTAIRDSVFEKFAIVPFMHQRACDSEQLAWLAGCDVEAILLHSAPAATFSYHTSFHCHASAFTLELGKAQPFGQNDLSRFSGIAQGLRQLLAAQAPKLAACPPLFRAKYNLVKHSEAFRLNLDAQVENFTLLPDGYLIAEDGATRYVAQGGEERILFPNPGVKPGLRAGIVIEPVAA